MKRYFNCFTDKPALSYRCGETITITVVPRKDNESIECKYIHRMLPETGGIGTVGFSVMGAALILIALLLLSLKKRTAV